MEINRNSEYFNHLKGISLTGRLYKRFLSSTLLFLSARRFGKRMLEIGSGTGSGLLGAFPKHVVGVEINPVSVNYTQAQGLRTFLIGEGGVYPFSDGAFDACVLDNVLEHIADPRGTLDECWRVTGKEGGLVIAVPGLKGFQSDPDHKIHYEQDGLRFLDPRWRLSRLYSLPFFFLSDNLSRSIRQYCIVAIYQKNRY
ncbi:MAG: methyltransferase domain-containing protein [Candidatus Accumulibacter sp. UW20]